MDGEQQGVEGKVMPDCTEIPLGCVWEWGGSPGDDSGSADPKEAKSIKEQRVSQDYVGGTRNAVSFC